MTTAPPTAAPPEPRIAAWDRYVDWPLTGLAVVFLIAYTVSVLDTTITPDGHDLIEVLLTGTWVVFGLDYLIRIALAERRWYYVGTHLLDLLILCLPMLRQLRALRVITVLTVLNRQLRDDVRGRVAFYVAGTVLLVGFVASVAVLDAERDAPGATITTFGEALWWTVTTISTVGYGDRYPVTVEGRVVAGSLMVAGIALLGVVTASIASWFVENLRQASAAAVRDIEGDIGEDVDRAEAKLDRVLTELQSISARLDALERDRTG
ncbi:potassium channel family protein [Pseudonocardia sp. GCM10023141]|uniref:potassium channel family protein n=1 Tax=Pseudonocardia sp. GCM10023141 TaxID=3252653 RepID=UPI00360B31CE